MNGNSRLLQRPRLNLRGLLGLIAVIALGLGIWRESRSPVWAFRQAIHSPRHEFHSAWKRLNQYSANHRPGVAWAELERAAADSHPSVRTALYDYLPFLGLDPDQEFALFEKAAADGEPSIRQSIYHNMDFLTLPPDRQLRLILDHVDDLDPAVRAATAGALGHASRESDPSRVRVIDPLLKLLDDGDRAVRLAAVEGLTTLIRSGAGAADRYAGGVQYDRVLSALSRALHDRDREVRSASALLLVFTGRQEQAIPRLIESFRELDRLGYSWDQEPHSKTLTILAGRSDQVADFIIGLLSRVDRDYPQAVRVSLAFTASTDPASSSWTRIERRAMIALQSPDPRIRSNVAILLDQMGSKARLNDPGDPP